MKKLETSMKPSSNPLIGLNAHSLNSHCPPETPDLLGFSVYEPDEATMAQTILRLSYQEEHTKRAVIKAIHKERARHAGKAPKSDALNILIENIVRSNPNISAKELEATLRNTSKYDGLHGGIILTITDDLIEYKNGENKKGDAIIKTAKISGLKDRLTNAKKRIAESLIQR